MKQIRRQNILKSILTSYESIDKDNLLNTQNILGIVEFSNKSKSVKELLNKPIPYLNLEMECLSNKDYVELWVSDAIVTYHSTEMFEYSFDGNNMLGVASFTEEHSVNKHYNELFELTEKTNYPYINRIWNYIPDINGINEDNVERYKAFCSHRWNSFNDNCIYQYPAGTAVGTQSKKTGIYFVSSSSNNIVYNENPEQTPAYKYNKTESPCFSRGCYNYKDDIFYISGTASITKNKTTNINDVENQCLATLDNISSLITKQNLTQYNINKNLTLKDIDCIKVYIKHNKDFKLIQEICSKIFSSTSSIVYLKADICRSELLLEIEGLIQHNSNNIFS